MGKSWSLLNPIVLKYFFGGMMFGLMFPLLAILFELDLQQLSLCFQNIIVIHTNNKLLFMIDTVPLFLGLFAYIAGVHQANVEETNNHLEKLVIIDELTKINNRFFGRKKLNEMIPIARDCGSKIGVFFIDLDRFKSFNDSLGHWFGDQLLIAVAERLIEGQQPGEFIARLGGDEFLVLVEYVQTIQALESVARRYAELFQRQLVVNNKSYTVDISMGISAFPDNGKEMDALFQNADVALYANKYNKKKGYEFFDNQMLVSVNEIFMIEKELHNALESGELSVVYQPIIDIKTTGVVAAEALLRWNSSVLGVVPAEKFIPVAESTNLIVEIGKWVLKEACIQNKRWQDAGLDAIQVSVNVSTNQLFYPDFVNVVRQVIKETGLAGRYIKLEITESCSMKNLAEVRAIFHELKQMEIQLSIDDFGTGYSSLSELRVLVADDIKIDKSFIDDIYINGSMNDASIIEPIILIAKKLKLKVIAEGVETLDQLLFLKSTCCDYIQGDLFSRPISAGEFARILGHRRDITKRCATTQGETSILFE